MYLEKKTNSNMMELVYLMRCGDKLAENELYRRYYEVVRKIVKKYNYDKSIAIDEEDLMQLGIICFHKVIRSYRDDMNAYVLTYIGLCITRRIQLEIRKQIKMANGLSNYNRVAIDGYVSYDDSRKYSDFVEDKSARYKPDVQFHISEVIRQLRIYEKESMSLKERAIFAMLNDGYDAKEIASEMGISIKAVYNTIYRVLGKMRKNKDLSNLN